MEIRITYKGDLKGTRGLWCGNKPKGLKVEEEISVYYPDKGKIFVKNNEKFDYIILQNGESIEDYIEANITKEEE